MASEVVHYRDLVLTNEVGTTTFALAVHPELHEQCARDTTLAVRMFEMMERMFPQTNGIKTLSGTPGPLDESFQLIAALGLVLPEAKAASGKGVSISTNRAGQNTTQADPVALAASASQPSESTLFNILRSAPADFTSREKVRYLELVTANMSDNCSNNEGRDAQEPKSLSHPSTLPITRTAGTEEPHPLPSTSRTKETEESRHLSDSEWKDDEVKLLANLRKEMEHLFTGANRKKKHGWQKIAVEMSKHGHNKSFDDCDRKFRSLINRHKIVSDRRKKSGEGRNPWKHFELIDELFGDSPSVTPVSSFSTLPSPSTSSSSAAPDTTPLTPSTSEMETTATPDQVETPRSRKRRRITAGDEPEWMATYRKEVKEMHRERIEVEKRKLSAIEDLIKVLSRGSN